MDDKMIPKIIHYCWFGEKPLPSEVKECIKSWKEKCPDYQIKCWTEQNFDVQAHPFTKAAYEAKAWAFVSDYARLKAVYDNGGIYLDTDVELLKNLDELLYSECYIGIQQADNYCTTGLGFGATQHNKVVLMMMRKYDDLIFSEEDMSSIACPKLNDSIIRSLGTVDNQNITHLKDVTVYPSYYFDPYGGNLLMCSDTVSAHHYSASWTKGSQRLKRKIARIIGTGRIIKLKKLLGKI